MAAGWRAARWAALWGWFGLAAACSDDFAPASRVVDFRLLAVSAEPTFAAPGEQVNLQTLSFEPFGRPVTWGWATCTAPADSTVNACLLKRIEEIEASGEQPLLASGEALTEFSVTVPADVLDSVAESARRNATVGVITVACPGEIGLLELADIAPGELPISCRDAQTAELLPSERFAVSVKRIFVRTVDRNQTPPIDAVLWDGELWPEGELRQVMPCSSDGNAFDDCQDGQKVKLQVSVPPTAFEQGTDEFGDAFSEEVITQFYATEGSFEFEVRTADVGETTWVARQSAAGQLVTLWFVVRDNRGAVSWTSRQVQVEAR